MRPVPVLLAALLVGCSGAAVPPAPTVTIAAPLQAAGPATEAPTAAVPTRSMPAVVADDSVGVPECDEYLARLEACVRRVPTQDQDAVQEALRRMREPFRQGAVTPKGRTGLKTACQAALEGLTTNLACK